MMRDKNQMNPKSKQQVTPKLRFPEFRDAGGWEEKNLGEIVALEYGSPLPEKNRKGGLFPVIGSNGIVGYHDEAIVDGPAIVVGRKGSAGQVKWIESDCYPIDTTFFVKNLDPESCPIAFLWRLLERSNLERLGDAGAVPFSESLPIYIRITDIDDEGQFAQNNRVSVDIEATEENYLVEGDIVLARTGASVGKSYRYRQNDGRLVFAGFLIRVRPNPKKLVPGFLFNYLTTWQYWDWIRVNSARSGQPGINGNEYASMPIPLPPADTKGNEIAEQQKIASCLTALDDQIAAQTQKIAALQRHKKGLMQQLFPAPEDAV